MTILNTEVTDHHSKIANGHIKKTPYIIHPKITGHQSKLANDHLLYLEYHY